MVILGATFRDMQNEVPTLNLPWNQYEPHPDHSTIHKAFQKLDQDYLDLILEKTAYMSIKESSWKNGVLAVDSSGVETDRYETSMRPHKKEGKIRRNKTTNLAQVPHRGNSRLPYHPAGKNNERVQERFSRTQRASDEIRDDERIYIQCRQGYDADANFKRVFELLMIPNIKQRELQKGVGHKRLRYRSKAKKIFDVGVYHYRGIIEAIFGAEETDNHNLKTKFRLVENQESWGKILAIGWNLKVLNRLQSAKSLGIKVGSTIRN
jgi:hypothetical protein